MHLPVITKVCKKLSDFVPRDPSSGNLPPLKDRPGYGVARRGEVVNQKRTPCVQRRIDTFKYVYLSKYIFLSLVTTFITVL